MKARFWIGSSAALAVAGYALWRRRPREPRLFRLELPGEAVNEFENGSVLFIGTATALIRFAGLTVLTDPSFLHRGEEIHIGYGMRSSRLTDPSMNFEDLPPLDLVVLSHLREDHFDRLVQERLGKSTPIFTTPSSARALRKRGFLETYPMHTWDRAGIRKGSASLRLTSLPGRRGPLLAALALPSVMGAMLEFRRDLDVSEYRIYVSGDTLAIPGLREIPRRYPQVDLALLHLGGTRSMGMLVTMNAKQGIETLRIVRPDVTVPIHYNDYGAFKEPLEEFVRAVEAEGLRDRVNYLRHGESYSFVPRVTEVEPRVASY